MRHVAVRRESCAGAYGRLEDHTYGVPIVGMGGSDHHAASFERETDLVHEKLVDRRDTLPVTLSPDGICKQRAPPARAAEAS
jgi:hypothetical protein